MEKKVVIMEVTEEEKKKQNSLQQSGTTINPFPMDILNCFGTHKNCSITCYDSLIFETTLKNIGIWKN